jgi:hypothetical protein
MSDIVLMAKLNAFTSPGEMGFFIETMQELDEVFLQLVREKQKQAEALAKAKSKRK